MSDVKIKLYTELNLFK